MFTASVVPRIGFSQGLRYCYPVQASSAALLELNSASDRWFGHLPQPNSAVKYPKWLEPGRPYFHLLPPVVPPTGKSILLHFLVRFSGERQKVQEFAQHAQGIAAQTPLILRHFQVAPVLGDGPTRCARFPPQFSALYSDHPETAIYVAHRQTLARRPTPVHRQGAQQFRTDPL